MRKEKQKIRRSRAVTGAAHRGDQVAKGYGRYRVTGGGHHDVLIIADSPEAAEQVARRLLGSKKIYRKPQNLNDVEDIVRAILDPEGCYEGALEVRRVESSTPAALNRR